MIEESGAVHMLGRSDDVIKVAGRRISGVQIEKIIATHPGVHACAVVAIPDALRGQRPLAYVVAARDLAPPSAEDILRQVHQTLGRWVGIKEKILSEPDLPFSPLPSSRQSIVSGVSACSRVVSPPPLFFLRPITPEHAPLRQYTEQLIVDVRHLDLNL
uniref:acetate--CoA ligase n=1 Tax=Megaselia scalaris TaxID=36166 RepID=T1GCQ4_MEGSC